MPERYRSAMHEGASSGGTFIPAPVQLDTDDADVAFMWREVERKRFGIVSPWLLAFGILQLVQFGLGFAGHMQWWTLPVGIGFVALAFHPKTRSSKVVRAVEVRFADDGLHIDVAFALPMERMYRWGDILRIDDIADAFVLIPRFDLHVVMPKRAFPGYGTEAWAFFAAHGVAGRITPPQRARVVTA